MDKTGKTIASSNRNAPDSFVGKSYQFRPYFTQAISGNRSRYVAMGITSLKRGFYISFPIRDGRGDIIGVVAMKTELDDIEAEFSGNSNFFFINHQGIIFLSNRKEMLFKSLWPIGREAERRLLASKQFGEKQFEAMFSQEIADGMDVTLNGKHYLVSRRVVDPEGWSVVLMNTTERIRLYKSTGVILTTLICTFIIIPLIVNYKTARSAELLRESENRFRELYDNMKSGVAVYEAVDGGRDFVFRDCNGAAEKIDQLSKADVVGKSVSQIFPAIKEFGLFEIFQSVWKDGIPRHHPVSHYKDGRIGGWRENYVYKLPSGEIVAIYDDVTESKKREEEIQFLAVTDILTGLYNRRGFMSLADQQMKTAKRTGKKMSLLFIDIDGMKHINDTWGHEEGDRALVSAATILKQTFRESDILTRIGGDEFAVLAFDAAENPEIVLGRLADQTDLHNAVPDRLYKLSMSIGTTVYDPEVPCSLDDLISRADTRMYEQKKMKSVNTLETGR
jgi:diguanylate cyclase (GGDEF)-like protein